MRIIAGQLRRRNLRVPRGDITRPSTDRTRESLFALVQSRMELEGADVLDLFAGSGALGLEAISRGATRVTFVENHPVVMKYTRQNASDLGVEDRCLFVRADAMSFISRHNGRPFDLILADPPYDLEGLERLPEMALAHLAPGGLFVLEHDKRHSFADTPRFDVCRAYGRTIVTIFQAEQPPGQT